MVGTDIQYWDTCIFLALLKKEEYLPGELKYVEDQARKFDIGALNLVTSALTITEILEGKLTPEQNNKLGEIFARSNFQFINADHNVCILASEIRNHYVQNPVREIGLKPINLATPDAIQVASAIVAQSALKRPLKLLTFDTNDKPGRGEMALTRLDGLVAKKYLLSIGRPDLKHQQADLAFTSGGAAA